jgi:hypothetical protein
MLTWKRAGVIVAAALAFAAEDSTGEEGWCFDCNDHSNNGQWDCTDVGYDAQGRVHDFEDIAVAFAGWSDPHLDIYCGECDQFHNYGRSYCYDDEPPQNLAVESAITSMDAHALRDALSRTPSRFVASADGKMLATLDCRGAVSRVFVIPDPLVRVTTGAGATPPAAVRARAVPT